MASINDVYEGLTKIGESIAKMGGSVQSANRSFSLKELADGVETIPTYIVTGGGQAVQVFEMPNTTIAVYDTSDNLIGSGTTDATTGGAVNVNITTAGTYRVTATKGGNVIWNKQVTVSNGEVTIVKTPLTLDDYTEDEIEASCVNHYAHHMFNVGDYRTEASFMGSTDSYYRKKYILGFNQKELADGSGYAEITWGFLSGTPSSYAFDTIAGNFSWEGSLMRQRCLPSGEDYYRYDSTVDGSTSGTYYIYDYSNKTWVAKTLPVDFDSDANYYVKSTTVSDGVFYTDALPSGTLAHAKKVKNLTWTGRIKGQTTESDNVISNALIETQEKLFLPSCFEIIGNRPNIGLNRTYWSYNQKEGEKVLMSINDIWNIFGLHNLLFRSPSLKTANVVNNYNVQNGYITESSVTSSSNYALICYCQ